MKLRQFLEMSLPMVNNVQQATSQIQTAYDTAVVRKQPNADVKGGVRRSSTMVANATKCSSVSRSS